MSPAHGAPVAIDNALVARLGSICTVVTDAGELATASRDWWPLALVWEAEGTAQPVAALVARPTTTEQVADVLRASNAARVPVTVAAGRSGVCGGSVPVHGGVVLDLTALDGIVGIDRESLVLDVRAGTFGTPLEDELRAEHGLTLGHFPQSIDISTVGGWLACRGAGQKSTRYGKIEDMATGLDVVLADGRIVHTGGAPRAAVGPDLTQLFVGSEGTLGVITGARLRLHPAPAAERRGAWRPPSVAAGLAATRRVLQRGATPAVVRLYDGTEAERNFGVTPEPLLLVLDEGDPFLVDAVERIVHEEFAEFARADDALVAQWWEHRNDVSALHRSIEAGLVVDTMEIAAPWSALDALYTDVCAALLAVDGVLMASAHLSHAYTDGACLYFTFAGVPDDAANGGRGRTREQCYTEAWDAAVGATLRGGANLSHHHGIGVNRARHVGHALGAGLAVLQSLKDALDPHGILNPGKLGLRDPFGEPTWP